MTTAQPPRDEPHPPAGYVPAFEGADGNEDPAPEPVVHSKPPAPVGPDDQDDQDGRFAVAEEISFDQHSDAARRVGQLPLDFAGSALVPGQVDPGAAIAQALRTDAIAAPVTPGPGDESAPGSAQAGEAVCPECAGSGKTRAGIACAQCGGTGVVNQIVGDA